MTDSSMRSTGLPLQQQAIRDKCFHPTGTFIYFNIDEIEQSIPDRFEQQVRLYSDRLAVKTRDHQLTYNELNKAANRLARSIKGLIGAAQQSIALLLGNDPQIPAAVLGVLKTRNTLVLLDPEWPQERTVSILEDSNARLILTNNEYFQQAEDAVQGGRRLMNRRRPRPS